MKNNQFSTAERRKYLRIRYRPSERPTLKIGKSEFEILDLNEQGLAIQYGELSVPFDLEKKVSGLVM